MNINSPENNLLNFIRSNSKIFIYSLAIILITLSIFFWYLNKKENNKIIISDNYIKAQSFLKNEKKDDAKKILLDIVKKNNSPYSSLALFLIIENNLVENKSMVLGYFDKIIDNSNLQKEDLNLIKFKKAIYISDLKNEQDILKLLNPIINSNSVWKNHALKFLGDFYRSNNQTQKANQITLPLFFSIFKIKPSFEERQMLSPIKIGKILLTNGISQFNLPSFELSEKVDIALLKII